MEVSGFSEAEIREFIRIRKIEWREEDDHVDLEDVAAKVALREFDRLEAEGLSEGEAEKQGEVFRERALAGKTWTEDDGEGQSGTGGQRDRGRSRAEADKRKYGL